VGSWADTEGLPLPLQATSMGSRCSTQVVAPGICPRHDLASYCAPTGERKLVAGGAPQTRTTRMLPIVGEPETRRRGRGWQRGRDARRPRAPARAGGGAARRHGSRAPPRRERQRQGWRSPRAQRRSGSRSGRERGRRAQASSTWARRGGPRATGMRTSGPCGCQRTRGSERGPEPWSFPSRGRTVFGSTSKTRVVARMPNPSAKHAKTWTISSTEACLP
jgi:hypothetical protein